MKINKKRAGTLGVALGLATVGAVALATAAPAAADPVSNGYAIVGSDTLQEAVGAIANGTTVTGASVRIALNGTTLASYDAFPSASGANAAAIFAAARGIAGALIQTQPGGPAFVRPQGSGNGVAALSASYNVDPANDGWLTLDISGQVQAARSSSGRTANVDGPLRRFAFGHDAISYALIPGASVDPDALDAAVDGAANTLAALTKAQLQTLFSTAPTGGDDYQFGVSSTFVYGLKTAVTVAYPVVPRLPQNGSGTRSDWLGSSFLNVTPNGVTNQSTTTIQENSGTDPEIAAYLVAHPTAIVLVPFSASSYIAQENEVATRYTTANVTLGAPDGRAAYTIDGGTLVPDASSTGLYHVDSAFDRDTYIVVSVAALATDPGVAQLVDPTYNKSLTYWDPANNNSNTSKAVKLLFGFSAPVESNLGTRISAEG